MAMWKKALVVGLAVILGALPVLARVDPGLQLAVATASQASVPLPQGDELGDEELVQYDGELAFLAVLALVAGWGALSGWACFKLAKTWGSAGAAIGGAIATAGAFVIGGAYNPFDPFDLSLFK